VTLIRSTGIDAPPSIVVVDKTMTNELFEDLVNKAVTALPRKLQQQAAEVLIVTMSNPPLGAPEESLVAFVQSPTNLRFEVYKSAFDHGTEQEVLEKLKTVLTEEFGFYFGR
jgi:predicted Zn-dependent protease with MMP-like domain